MYFTDFSDFSGVIQDTLRGGRFAGVNVSHDTYISCFIQREVSGHGFNCSFF